MQRHKTALGASVNVMALFRRRQPLDLRPTAEWNERFIREHPNADQLLAEADDYLAQREAEYQRELESQAEAEAALLEKRARKAIAMSVKSPVGTRTCGAITERGKPCTQIVAAGTKKCAAGHVQR